MKTLTQTFSVALLTTLVTYQVVAQAEQQVVNSIKSHWNMLNSGNVASFATNFVADGFSAASSEGSFWEYERQSTEEAVEQTKGVKFDFHPHHISVIMLGKDMALATYYLVGSITPSEGEGITNYRTRASQIWVKDGSGWKIKHEHFSALFGGAGIGG